MEFKEPYEYEEQEWFFEWARMNFENNKYPYLHLIYATLNGIRMQGWGTKAKAKKGGLRKGVLDICLPVPRKKFHGLYIEMKRALSGYPTKEQKEEIKDLRELGYKVEIAHGFKEAIEIIEEYYGE